METLETSGSVVTGGVNQRAQSGLNWLILVLAMLGDQRVEVEFEETKDDLRTSRPTARTCITGRYRTWLDEPKPPTSSFENKRGRREPV